MLIYKGNQQIMAILSLNTELIEYTSKECNNLISIVRICLAKLSNI
jgi:hypothetical protein